MRTLQGYVVLRIENKIWGVKDLLNHCMFACNVLLYYVAMQPWLWGPGPMHMLPPGRQPDNPLHHCTHIIYCLMNIFLFLWQSETVLHSKCMHECVLFSYIFKRLCQIRATKPFAIVRTERIVAIFQLNHFLYLLKIRVSTLQRFFHKNWKPRICCP